jgi:hypothetical protein
MVEMKNQISELQQELDAAAETNDTVNPVEHVRDLEKIIEECHGFKDYIDISVNKAWGIQVTFAKLLSTALGRKAGILYKV